MRHLTAQGSDDHLDNTYRKAFDRFKTHFKKLPVFRHMWAVIQASHAIEEVRSTYIPFNIAAKVMVPDYDEDNNFGVPTAAQKEAVENLAATSPEYAKHITQYAEWMDICEGIFDLVFSAKFQGEQMQGGEYDTERKLLINRIFNAQTGEMSEAESMFDVLERSATKALSMQETRPSIGFVDKTPMFRKACNHFMDDMLLDGNGVYMAQRKALVYRITHHNQAHEKIVPITVADVLNVVNTDLQHIGVPTLWNHRTEDAEWKSAQQFLKYDSVAESHAMQMVQLCYAYEQVFSMAYAHRNNIYDFGLVHEVQEVATALNKACPEIDVIAVNAELSRALGVAQEAIRTTRNLGTGFAREA